MSDTEKQKDKMEKQSWISNLILKCPDSNGCAFSNENKPHQHAFPSTRIVAPNSDSRSLLTVVKGVIFSNLEPVPFDPSLDAEPESCFNCKRKGHAYKKCWREKTLYCVNCGRHEVQVGDCPRCAEGYREFVKSGRTVRALPLAKDVSEKDRSRARSVGRACRDKSRGRMRNDEILEMRNPRNKSRGRSTVRWSDLEDSHGKNSERKGREQGGTFGDGEVKDESFAKEFDKGAIREFLDVMAAVKHLPPETQNAVALHFLRERGTVIEAGELKSE